MNLFASSRIKNLVPHDTVRGMKENRKAVDTLIKLRYLRVFALNSLKPTPHVIIIRVASF